MGIYRTKAEIFEAVDEHRREYKLYNNTWQYQCSRRGTVIRFHLTDIMEFRHDGSIRLDSGGHQSVTTKDRLNKLLPGRWHVVQRDHEWYLIAPDGTSHDFYDGMVILPDGTVSHPNEVGAAMAFELEAGRLTHDDLTDEQQVMLDAYMMEHGV